MKPYYQDDWVTIYHGDWDLPFEKEAALKAFDRKVLNLEKEADELKAKKQMFIDRFGVWFDPKRTEVQTEAH